MKKIYFVQSSSVYGGEVCVPYASGAIAAYAWMHDEIKREYELAAIIHKKESFSDVKEMISEPFLVAFSCYIWNFEHNKIFAKALKEQYPDCLILFGGHNVSNNSSSLLEECPYIDFLIHDEGEVPFYKLLLALKCDMPLNKVSNLSYRDNGKIIKTENLCYDVSDFPSPYAAGLFDEMLKSSGDTFYGILETNRGCPYKCVYCDWGRQTNSIRQFPIERVRGDIQWLSDNKIGYSVCADANFGILERDILISQWLVKAKEETGYPSKIQFCFTKNSDDRVFLINKMMNGCGLSKGATISLQTLSPQTLSDICRSNMTYEHYTSLVRKYNEAGIYTYTDIILGLPGETYESFTRGIGKLFEAGQHTSVNVFNCEVLINARLASEEMAEKYSIRHAKCVLNKHHSEVGCEVEEGNTVVVATSSMNEADWIKANIFVALSGCLHNLSLLQFFAIYLFHEKNIPYESFYSDIYEHFIKRPDTLLGAALNLLYKMLEDVTLSRDICQTLIPEYGNVNWPVEEWLFLKLAEDFNRFYNEITGYLHTFGIDNEIFSQLLTYQSKMIKKPGITEVTFDTEYNFPEYFKNIYEGKYKTLKKQPLTISIFDKNARSDKKSYAKETVWYGRKGGRIVYKEEMTIVERS